jgi:hypothetical protein
VLFMGDGLKRWASTYRSIARSTGGDARKGGEVNMAETVRRAVESSTSVYSTLITLILKLTNWPSLLELFARSLEDMLVLSREVITRKCGFIRKFSYTYPHF